MAVFQIFQDTFFCGPLISIQEGLVKSLILVPPLFAAETDLFGPSYGCGAFQLNLFRCYDGTNIMCVFVIVKRPTVHPQ